MSSPTFPGSWWHSDSNKGHFPLRCQAGPGARQLRKMLLKEVREKNIFNIKDVNKHSLNLYLWSFNDLF